MLNDLTYDASSTSNTSLFTLVEGAASFVAGQVAKTGDMKVATPVATIGIRGTEDGLPDDFSRLLFRMSSLLPQRLQEAANSDGIPAGAGARGFVFNADLVSIIRFLDIGTRVSRGVR